MTISLGFDNREMHRGQGEDPMHEKLIRVRDPRDLRDPDIADGVFLGHGVPRGDRIVVHQFKVLPIPLARQKEATPNPVLERTQGIIQVGRRGLGGCGEWSTFLGLISSLRRGRTM